MDQLFLKLTMVRVQKEIKENKILADTTGKLTALPIFSAIQYHILWSFKNNYKCQI